MAEAWFQRTSGLWRLGLQYARFSAIGAAATATHLILFVGLVELLQITPLLANLVAFAAAVQVSFSGHLHCTFRTADGAALPRGARAFMLRKFVVVAVLGLGLNSLAVYVVTDVLRLPYGYAAAAMVTIVPATIFLLSKFWAFRVRPDQPLETTGIDALGQTPPGTRPAGAGLAGGRRQR